MKSIRPIMQIVATQNCIGPPLSKIIYVYHSLIRAFAYYTKYICPVLKILAIDAGEIRNRIININAQQKIRKKTDKNCCLKH